jgi:CDP-glycerol glycerophosphotransferase (TagB/SpsB family)
MVDGAAINTRKKDEKGSTWRENKLGLVFSIENLRKRKDGVTQDILQKEYVASIGKVDEFPWQTAMYLQYRTRPPALICRHTVSASGPSRASSSA